MMNIYSAARHKRAEDEYSPGGRAGRRPPGAAIVYANRARECFPGLHVVLGGIEASTRRFPHYDYWKDGIRHSVLLDSKADILVYGPGERAALEIARRLKDGETLESIQGTAIPMPLVSARNLSNIIEIPSFEDIAGHSALLGEATAIIEREMNPYRGRAIISPDGDRAIVSYRPPEPPSSKELDDYYELSFSRRAHPSYKEPIPALETVRFSVTIVRGCSGGCSFCSLAMHQGKFIASRSADSVIREIELLAQDPDFKGTITDLGGPTANLWGALCSDTSAAAACRRPSCLHPKRCPNFTDAQTELVELYKRAMKVKGVKHLLIASGIRHDVALDNEQYMRQLVSNHVGGHLKVAPEQASDTVLRLMRKPSIKIFEKFMDSFEHLSKEAGLEQYLVPYFISAFPGETEKDLKELARWLGTRHWKLRQVQEFIPSPGTLATAIWVSGRDPQNGEKIPVGRGSDYRKRSKETLTGTTVKNSKISSPPRRRRRGSS